MREGNMVDLPQKKVGIVACSGEELAEGTVTRLAALKVLEQLRPKDTVTICLPLFLAGGEGDRAFARFYPTIAIDGCNKRCAAKATELYSGKPAASIVVADLLRDRNIGTARHLNEVGVQAVGWTAEHVVESIDELLGKQWDRRTGEFVGETPAAEETEAVEATCSCGSGIPVQKVNIDGQVVTLIALPTIFQQFHEQGKLPEDGVTRELLDRVKIYNVVPAEQETYYLAMLDREYTAYCAKVIV
jgi:uncharacterized metal-binding protein